MKNFLNQFTLVTLALLVFACSKKNEAVVPTSINDIKDSVFVKNGRMVFAEISNYENMVKDTTSREKTFRSVSSENFFSLATNSSKASVNASLYDSKFLQRVLNQDGIVQIGEWIIKVDLAKSLCFVLNKKHENEYVDLVKENSSNTHISSYSTDENVLELLASHQSSAKTNGLFCKDRSARVKKDEGFEYLNVAQTLRLDCKVVYQKAGIYFSLQGKIKAQEKIAGVWFQKGLRMDLSYAYSLNVRCGYYDTNSGSTGASDNNEQSYRPYESARGLENYSYAIRLGVYNPEGGGLFYVTRLYQISDY